MNQGSVTDHRGNEAGRTVRKTFSRIWLITVLVAIVLISVVWMWKTLQLREERRKASEAAALYQQKANRQLLNDDSIHLLTIVRPLVWLFRDNMLNSNTKAISLYSDDLVKSKGFRRIAVIDTSGNIITSTDKYLEGKNYAAIGPQTDLKRDNTSIRFQDSLYVVTSPITGPTNRLGTLELLYAPQLIIMEK